ncbi:hypothetical protein [Alteribacter aurantiacus]|nr:hypothetical protein [Alteribacter aurantiacus]
MSNVEEKQKLSSEQLTIVFSEFEKRRKAKRYCICFGSFSEN